MTQIAAMALCGLAIPLAFAPYGLFWILLPVLALVLALLDGASPRRAALLGYVFGVSMFGHGVWWVQVSVHQFGLPVYAFSITITALFIAFLAIYPALFAYFFRRFDRLPRASRLLLMAPALWTLSELLRAWLFTGFPWLLLGYSQTDSPLSGLYPLLGAYGVSFAIVVLSSIVLLVIRGNRSERIVASAAGVMIIGMSVLGARSSFTETFSEPQDVALIQGAVPQAIKWQRRYRDPTIDLYSELTKPHWGKAVVVWPETAIPAFLEEVPDTIARLDELASDSGTSLLLGIATRESTTSSRHFNSVIQLGASAGRYDKHHLVPFGEYFPFDAILRPILRFLSIPMSNFSAGDSGAALVANDKFKMGVSICYEDAYAREIARALPEAELLINVSNDAWFGDSIAPHQHLQIARVRSLEVERVMLRSTNTGISAIIDQRGRVLARSQQFEPDVITANVELRRGATPFSKWPFVTPLLSLILVCAYLARARRATII